jgi:hypothetical protein
MKMMIPANLKPWLMPALLGLAVLAVTGCQGPGYQKSDSVALNAQTAAVHVHGVLRDLDLATNTLHELVNQPATDAKPQFLRFSQALDRLSHSSKNSSERVKALGRNRTPYFEVWDKELLAIKDEEVRKRSQARRDEVRTQFDATIRQSLEAHDSVQPVVAFLSDVRTALSTDLTQKGLVSMQPLLGRAAELTGQAQGKLGKLATDLDSLSARMASYRVLEGKEVK